MAGQSPNGIADRSEAASARTDPGHARGDRGVDVSGRVPVAVGAGAVRGLGVKSNTVGSQVAPVTSSQIVRANGIPVQRYGDRCTLNQGNCPGEYVHVKSTATHEAPDGLDQLPWYKKAWDWTGEKLGQAG